MLWDGGGLRCVRLSKTRLTALMACLMQQLQVSWCSTSLHVEPPLALSPFCIARLRLLVALQSLLDRLDKLNSKAIDLDVTLLDKKIDQMMPELGFKQADNDRLVASFSGGWQMRMCLGKLLLQVRRGLM
jgi:ATPase subunit of ABC transporter with duplicated ATPase domains